MRKKIRSRMSHSNKGIQRIYNRGRKLKAKAYRSQSRRAAKQARLEERAVTSRRAQKKLERQAQSEARRAIEREKPQLYKEERIEEMKTKAQVSKTKARGTAGAAIASALGASGTETERQKTEAVKAQAEAEKAVAGAMSDTVNSVGNPSSNASVSGLIQGVR